MLEGNKKEGNTRMGNGGGEQLCKEAARSCSPAHNTDGERCAWDVGERV
jgi:hypothetical protein